MPVIPGPVGWGRRWGSGQDLGWDLGWGRRWGSGQGLGWGRRWAGAGGAVPGAGRGGAARSPAPLASRQE